MGVKAFIPWTYTADDGNQYRVNVVNYITTQLDGTSAAKIGGQQATTDVLPMPASMKMRTALVFDAVSGTSRRVPCMTVTCDLWTNKDATVQLDYGHPTVMTTFNKYGTEGERSRHSKKLATA